LLSPTLPDPRVARARLSAATRWKKSRAELDRLSAELAASNAAHGFIVALAQHDGALPIDLAHALSEHVRKALRAAAVREQPITARADTPPSAEDVSTC